MLCTSWWPGLTHLGHCSGWVTGVHETAEDWVRVQAAAFAMPLPPNCSFVFPSET